MRIEYTDQLNLAGETIRTPTRVRFDPPVAVLRKALESVQHECWSCGVTGYATGRDKEYNVQPIEVYDDPWEDTATIIWAHDSERRPVPYGVAQSCLEAIESPDITDFHYFGCACCGRTVIVRCPSNGWHSYRRMVNEFEEWCLACVEETLLAKGIAGFPAELDEVLNDGLLFGMFFNVNTLEDDGWLATEYRVFINSEESAMGLASEARRLHDQGRLIIIGYESMAIGGSEGYVTLFSKAAQG